MKNRQRTRAGKIQLWGLVLGVALTSALAISYKLKGTPLSALLQSVRANATDEASVAYSVYYKSSGSLRSDAKVGLAGQEAFSEIEGTLSLEAISFQPSEWAVSTEGKNPTSESANLRFYLGKLNVHKGTIRVSGNTLKLGQDSEAGQDTKVEQELEGEFLISTSEGFKLTGIAFGSQSSLLTKGLLRSILSLSQVSVPRDSEKESWESQEVESFGHYLAQYRTKKSSKSVFEIEKRVESTPDINALAKGQFSVKRSFLGSFRVSKDTLLIEEGTYKGNYDSIVFGKTLSTSHAAIVLSRIPQPAGLSKDMRLAAQLRNKMESPRISLELTPEEEAVLTAKSDEQQMKGETEATLKLKLEALVAHGNSRDVPHTHLMLMVESFARMNPSKIAFLEEMLVNADPESLVFSVVVPGLVRAGNESAQTHLVKASERKMASEGPNLGLSIIVSLGTIKRPTDETIDWLAGMSTHSDKGIASTSMLALGSLAGELDKVSQSKSLKLTQGFANELAGLFEARVENAKPETNERKALLLAALGNAGNASVEPIVSKVLATESDEEVRAEALGALRFVKTPTAKKSLFDNLNGTASRKIKEEIISAFRYTDLEPREIDSLVLFLKAEKESGIRQTLIDTLWLHHQTHPAAVRESLLFTSQNDSDHSLRKYAKDLLVTMPG